MSISVIDASMSSADGQVLSLGSVPDKNKAYAANTLAFVGVGTWNGIWQLDNYGTAAEILYTRQVKTPDFCFKIETQPVDQRRGVLVRGAWLMTGTAGNGWQTEDPTLAAYLSDLFSSQQQDRLSAGRGIPTKVWPWTSATKTSTYPASLKRVMATCASEFFVEYWDGSNWVNGTRTWPLRSDGWPQGIRVTVAVHPPEDTGPLPADQDRYYGYALQEVFWIGDP